jgi:hypothetical protein
VKYCVENVSVKCCKKVKDCIKPDVNNSGENVNDHETDNDNSDDVNQNLSDGENIVVGDIRVKEYKMVMVRDGRNANIKCDEIKIVKSSHVVKNLCDNVKSVKKVVKMDVNYTDMKNGRENINVKDCKQEKCKPTGDTNPNSPDYDGKVYMQIDKMCHNNVNYGVEHVYLKGCKKVKNGVKPDVNNSGDNINVNDHEIDNDNSDDVSQNLSDADINDVEDNSDNEEEQNESSENSSQHKSLNNNFNFLFWNINGMTSNIADYDFLNF